MKIACLISNAVVLELVRATFARASASCTHFAGAAALLHALPGQAFDLIVIDFAAAPAPGDTILSWLNCRAGGATPVLVLSPVSDAAMTALVLDCGADDVMVRPFEPVELAARARALVRRSAPRTPRRTIELAGFSLDHDQRSVAFRGSAVALTPREFSLAWMLFSAPGAYLSRDTIGIALWGADSGVTGRTIDQHVYKLRTKLQLDPQCGVVIRTVHGQGYQLGLGAAPTPPRTAAA